MFGPFETSRSPDCQELNVIRDSAGIIPVTTETQSFSIIWFGKLLHTGFFQDSYKEEVAAMIQSGRRAEIEALYCHGYDYLVKFLATKIVQANYH